MIVSLTLTDDQLDAIAERVAAKVGRKSDRPLTVNEAAERLGLCGRTVRRRVEAGEIARVPLCGAGARVLIPAAEIERLLNPQPEANAR
jgi:excisionase family DNA binding protein